MKVICYGDSNTWGYDPRSWLGDRYGADSRWADILAYDGVHFTPEGHRAFAEGLCRHVLAL